MTRKNWLLPLVLLGFSAFCLHASAATITANSCSAADVQAAIDAAANGDTIQVPVGTCSGNVTVPNTKGITLKGSIGGTTTLTSPGAVKVNASTAGTTRVTGFTFTGLGDSNAGDLSFDSSTSTKMWRADHNVFTSSSNPTFITHSGLGPGLIDHNTFTCSQGEMIHNLGVGPSDASGWTTDVVPGSAKMTFIEDNVFTNTNTTYLASALQSYYGARTVARHNTLNFSELDQHGTPGMVGARWYEFYENTINALNENQCCGFSLRAGSGVVFKNHLTGSWLYSAPSIEFREEDSGYPALYQVGRGYNEVYSPAYVWGNDSAIAVGSGSSNVVQGRDFVVSTTQPSSLSVCESAADGGTSGTCSHTIAYVPYSYPFPLDGNGLPNPGGTSVTPPASPTNLTAVVQ